MDSGRKVIEVLHRILNAVEVLPASERLFTLEHTWLVVAAWERNEALAFPGGFPDRKAQQLKALNRMADLVQADEPDLEVERLFREGDLAGVTKRLLKDGKAYGLTDDHEDD